jgi:hypothetical protein
MIARIVFTLLLLFPIILKAQETTIGKRNNSEAYKDSIYESREVLIVPYEKNMYRSDADNDIANASNMSVYELRTYFRYELHKHLEKALSGKKQTYNLLSENQEAKRDLDYLYYSTAYKYEALDGKSEKTENSQKGQIGGNVSSEKRFMNRTISNPKSLTLIHKKYGTEVFLFINEFNIAPADGTDQNDIMNETFNRVIRVHYSIMNKDGMEIKSGLAEEPFPYRKKKASVIVNDTFPAIAKKIVEQIP